jgi:hypothetical protein
MKTSSKLTAANAVIASIMGKFPLDAYCVGAPLNAK